MQFLEWAWAWAWVGWLHMGYGIRDMEVELYIVVWGDDSRTCFKRRVCIQDFYETATGNVRQWLVGLGWPSKSGNVCFFKWSRSPQKNGEVWNVEECESQLSYQEPTITYLFKIFKLLCGHNIFNIKWKINSRFDYFHTVVFVFSLLSQ